jgi:proteasome lid subunit RPN8/RPN11
MGGHDGADARSGLVPDAVRLPPAAAHAILAHAARDAPHEACGLLVGSAGAVTLAVPTVNLDASAARYTIPAAAHLDAIRAARREGLDVIGAYHSHPRGPASPSPTDRAEAFPGFVFLIAGLAPEPHLRAWQLVDGNFAELRLVRT